MDCFGGNIISFLRSVPALPISATPPGLYLILTFTFMHSLTIWSISGQAPPPLPISFSSSCLGLPFTSSPFTCFSLSPKPTTNMLVNSTWQDSLGAKNLHKKKLRAFGHEARSRLACDSESGAGMDAEADADSRRKVKAKADSSKHLQRHPRASVAAQCDAYSHDCTSTHTGCKSVDGCRLARNYAQLAYLQLAYCGLARITNSLLTANLPASRMMIASSDLCWHRSHHGLHKICRCVHFWQFCTNLQQVRKNLLQTCTNCATSVDLL